MHRHTAVKKRHPRRLARTLLRVRHSTGLQAARRGPGPVLGLRSAPS